MFLPSFGLSKHYGEALGRLRLKEMHFCCSALYTFNPVATLHACCLRGRAGSVCVFYDQTKNGDISLSFDLFFVESDCEDLRKLCTCAVCSPCILPVVELSGSNVAELSGQLLLRLRPEQ